MWPFKKTPKKPASVVKRLMTGLIIGGAIGSVVGKKLMEQESGKRNDEDKSE